MSDTAVKVTQTKTLWGLRLAGGEIVDYPDICDPEGHVRGLAQANAGSEVVTMDVVTVTTYHQWKAESERAAVKGRTGKQKASE